MASHDQQHGTAMAKARAKHIGATADAADAYDKVTSAAAAALAKAHETHDQIVGEAIDARRKADQLAQAELARSGREALAVWTKTERKAQNVPEEAFVRRTLDGRWTVHGAAGVPAAATARTAGNGEWTVDTEHGRAFVGGDELVMRRRLFAALMAPLAETEDGEVAA